MRYVFFIVCAISILSQGIAQQKLTKRKVSDKISVKLPDEFISMIASERNRRILSDREPIAAFTDQSRIIDFSVNESSTQWGVNDLPILKDFYRANILSTYSEVEFEQEDLLETNNRTYISFQFDGKVFDEKSLSNSAVSKYISIRYTVYNDKLLIFTFAAPLRLKNQWQTVAQEVMESIIIKK